jgi:hypothetical protein
VFRVFLGSYCGVKEVVCVGEAVCGYRYIYMGSVPRVPPLPVFFMIWGKSCQKQPRNPQYHYI